MATPVVDYDWTRKRRLGSTHQSRPSTRLPRVNAACSVDRQRSPGRRGRDSLGIMPSGVHRADSTRSDHSDTSVRSAESRGSAGKKVSFSRAVRVKKFPRRGHETPTEGPASADLVDGPPSPEKKFWCKVYKNRHQEKPRIPEETSYETVSDSAAYRTGRSTSRTSRKRPDSPVVKRNHVKKIVQKFDREAMLRQDCSSGESSPPPPVVRSHSVEEYTTRPGTPLELQRSPTPKRRNKLVNGVKVMLAPLTRKKRATAKTDTRDGTVRHDVLQEVNNNHDDVDDDDDHDNRDREEDLPPVMVDKSTQVKPFQLEEFFATDVSHLYSQVDKTKKTSFRTPDIYVSSPQETRPYSPGSSPKYAYDYTDKSAASSPALSRGTPDPEYGSIRKVKSSSRSFGFNLGRWEHKNKNDRDSDASSITSEPARDSRPGSVLREFDSKKRELSYENVSGRLSDDAKSRTASPTTSTSGVWVRDIDKDYRRGMADSDVTVPSSGYVFTYSATLGGGRSGKKKASKETSSRDTSPAIPESVQSRSPSRGARSVSSDHTSVRGGLAAAYQARQKAATSSSNGRVAKSSSPLARTNGGPGSSAGSAASEPAYRRNTVVLYIPGVSHHATPSDESVRVSRSQSMLQKDKPRTRSAQKQPKSSSSSSMQPHQRAASETDIRRTKSIPKGAKFPWLRIKPTVTATPVH